MARVSRYLNTKPGGMNEGVERKKGINAVAWRWLWLGASDHLLHDNGAVNPLVRPDLEDLWCTLQLSRQVFCARAHWKLMCTLQVVRACYRSVNIFSTRRYACRARKLRLLPYYSIGTRGTRGTSVNTITTLSSSPMLHNRQPCPKTQ